MLEIKDLRVNLEDENKEILKGVDLSVEAGKVHAIMGPNGSGKSTLSYVLSGKEGYEVVGGSVKLDGSDILEMELHFQYIRTIKFNGTTNYFITFFTRQNIR